MKYEEVYWNIHFYFWFKFWHQFWVFQHQLLQNMNFGSENMKKVLNLGLKYAK